MNRAIERRVEQWNRLLRQELGERPLHQWRHSSTLLFFEELGQDQWVLGTLQRVSEEQWLSMWARGIPWPREGVWVPFSDSGRLALLPPGWEPGADETWIVINAVRQWRLNSLMAQKAKLRDQRERRQRSVDGENKAAALDAFSPWAKVVGAKDDVGFPTPASAANLPESPLLRLKGEEDGTANPD